MRKRFSLRLIVLAIIVLVVVPLLTITRVFEFPELKAIDVAFQVRGRRLPSDDIVIVAIDDESFDQTELQWPWPRSYFAKIIRGISAGNPKVIVVDVFWYDPSSDPDGDAELAQAIAEAGNVILANELLFIEQQVDANTVIKIEQYQQPLPILTEAAYSLGLANFSYDPDGVVRRAAFYMTRQGDPAPLFHWSAIAAAKYLDAPLPDQYISNRARLGPYEVPLVSGTLDINFRSVPGTFRRIQAYQIPNEDRSPEEFTDKIVLIGATTESLHDTYPTPFTSAVPMPGVEIMANTIQTLIEGDFIVRWPRPVAALISIVLASIAFGLSRIRHLLVGLSISLALIVGYAILWLVVFIGINIEAPLVGPLVALSVGFAVPSVDRAITEELERRRIRNAFSHYLSPALVDQLARDPSQLKLGGERRNMTFLFTDIRGFTTISEQFDAEGLTRFINRFLTPMTDLIMREKGTIDKYMGDCIMAFWNAPIDDPDHASNACRAALDMRVELVDLNLTMQKEAKENDRPYIPIKVGIGLNTGDCSVGNMGSDQRFDYSVLGDDVNLASRLEGQSKNYGVDIVIGENTLKQAPGFATLELDLIQVKGKTVPVKIYTLLGDELLKDRREFEDLAEAHQAMLQAYRRQDWASARELVARCRELDVLHLELDALYNLYTERIETYAANPPGPDWDGVFVATTK